MNIEHAASPCHPYPAYKPSGVPTWATCRPIGNCAGSSPTYRMWSTWTEQRQQGEQYIALEHVESWTGKIREAGPKVRFDSQVKRFEAGDVLFGKLRPYLAKIAQPDCNGVCVGEFLVLRPSNGSLLPGYLARLLRSKPIINAIDATTFGAKMPRADWHTIGNMTLLRPPLAEQAAIVRYLDHADELINRYISVKERLIALLEEEKQAVVNQAVTRGLDPDAPLKPSGVEWLGDVPAHWEVRRLKHWVGINEAVLPENTDPYFEFRYLEIGAVGAGTLVSEPVKTRFGNAPSRARRIVRTGDTIVSTVRTYLKATWFAEDVKDDLICSTGFAVFTPRKAVWPNFVGYITQSNALTDRVTAASVGTAYPAIAESRLGAFHVALPPLDEQAAIVEYLDGATAGIDAAIARARRQIELIQEYRTRLIADVVTGRVDARAAAAGGPEDCP